MTKSQKKQVTRLREQGWTYKEIAERCGVSFDSVRNVFRVRTPTKQARPGPVPELTDADVLDQLGKKVWYVPDLAARYQVDKDRMWDVLFRLDREGYQVFVDRTNQVHLKKQRDITAPVHTLPWEGTNTVRFGGITDTHLGSIYQQLTFLEHAYTLFERLGITDVYHSGDVAEGAYMYRSQIYETFVHGADQQVEYVINKFPYRPTIKTRFITGNHDLSFLGRAGYDIGVAIAQRREDMEYLGQERAYINLTPNCKLELWHGRDGSAYAVSYAIQKYIEAMPGGEKPNILICGHRHKQGFFDCRNVQAFEGGCFQAQTSYMRGKKLEAKIGFWIFELQVSDNGTINRMKCEWCPLYTPKEKDY